MGISDQSPLRDFPAAGGKIIDIEAAGQAKLKEGGREEDGSPVKTPQLELTQDGKVWLTVTASLLVRVACVHERSCSACCFGASYRAEPRKENCQVLSVVLTSVSVCEQKRLNTSGWP